MTTAEKIAEKCDEIKALLLAKNAAYGDSALNPVRVFSNADPVEQIKVRLDDKLSRLARGTNTDAVPEDTLNDLIGYCILLSIAQEGPRLRSFGQAEEEPAPNSAEFAVDFDPAPPYLVN